MVGVSSVEKASGLKSKGDEDRSEGFVVKVGSKDRSDVSSARLTEGLEGESGELDLALLITSSDWERGNMASGLAIRKPPRDWDKLRSPSIVAGWTAEAGGLPRRVQSRGCLDRSVKRHMGGELVEIETSGKG